MATKRRPFHESILDLICCAGTIELQFLARIIEQTKISKGHDEIIAAWNNRMAVIDWDGGDLGIPACLLEQKREENEKVFSELQRKEEAGLA